MFNHNVVVFVVLIVISTSLFPSHSLELFAEYQRLTTVAATDIEYFKIGTVSYMAIANQMASYSTIYRYTSNKFVSYQNITSSFANDWEYFSPDGATHYLLLANFYNNTHKIDSVLYKWDGTFFQRYQAIPTIGNMDWESFIIDGILYALVANHFDGKSFDQSSVLYQWNGTGFVQQQLISTQGATCWTYFFTSGSHYAAIANQYSGTSNLNSVIYKWDSSRKQFSTFQSVATQGAFDWQPVVFPSTKESALILSNFYGASKVLVFNGATYVSNASLTTNGAHAWSSYVIGTDLVAAVANYLEGSSFTTTSTVYTWDLTSKSFQVLQSFASNGAYDVCFFRMDGYYWLVIANSFNGNEYQIDSVVYKLQRAQETDPPTPAPPTVAPTTATPTTAAPTPTTTTAAPTTTTTTTPSPTTTTSSPTSTSTAATTTTSPSATSATTTTTTTTSSPTTTAAGTVPTTTPPASGPTSVPTVGPSPPTLAPNPALNPTAPPPTSTSTVSPLQTTIVTVTSPPRSTTVGGLAPPCSTSLSTVTQPLHSTCNQHGSLISEYEVSCTGFSALRSQRCLCTVGFVGLTCDSCASGYIGYPFCTLACPTTSSSTQTTTCTSATTFQSLQCPVYDFTTMTFHIASGLKSQRVAMTFLYQPNPLEPTVAKANNINWTTFVQPVVTSVRYSNTVDAADGLSPRVLSRQEIVRGTSRTVSYVDYPFGLVDRRTLAVGIIGGSNVFVAHFVQAAVSTFTSYTLSVEFANAVRQLPGTYDAEIYGLFLNIWGTHFYETVGYGGLAFLRRSACLTTSTDVTSTSLDEVIFVDGGSGSVCFRLQYPSWVASLNVTSLTAVTKATAAPIAKLAAFVDGASDAVVQSLYDAIDKIVSQVPLKLQVGTVDGLCGSNPITPTQSTTTGTPGATNNNNNNNNNNPAPAPSAPSGGINLFAGESKPAGVIMMSSVVVACVILVCFI